MKKQALFVLLALSMGALAGCGHKHSFSTKWSYNKQGHYHECECGEHDKIQPHQFGKWYTLTEPTRDEYGVAERKCEVCSYKEHKNIDKIFYKLIEVYNGDTKVTEYRTDADGNYFLEVPEDQDGSYFAGYFDSTDAPFPIYGHIDDDVAIQMHTSTEPFAVNNEDALDVALKSSIRTVKTSGTISITRPHYVLSSITMKAAYDTSFVRVADYGGDMFVVGVDEDYFEVSSAGHPVTFTLDGTEAAMNINGNSTTVTVDVNGSAFFVAGMSELNLNGNVNVLYHHKVGNARVLPYDKESGEIQRITEAVKVGGSAIIGIDSTININGATFDHNEVNNSETAENKVSSYGGVIFTSGPLNISDGTFQYNTGSFGSVFYSLRKTTITQATFLHNSSYNYGTVYFADSQYSNAYLNAETAGGITFSDNYAKGSGGAIFIAHQATFEGSKIAFYNNTSDSNGGAINCKGILNLSECTFNGNKSDSKGGAIYFYYGDENEELDSHSATIASCNFVGNTGALGGAIGIGSQVERADDNYSEVTKYPTMTVNSSTFTSNSAVKSSADKYGHGGAFYAQKAARTTFNGCTFESNTAVGHAGAGYLAYASVTTFKNSSFISNSCGSSSNGGALYVTQRAHAECDGVTAKWNSTGNFGGFMYVGANSMPSTATLKDIESIENQAKEGGFIYVTTTDSSVTILSGSTTGCTASSGAAKNNIVTNHASCVIYVDLAHFTNDGTLHSGKGSVQDISNVE